MFFELLSTKSAIICVWILLVFFNERRKPKIKPPDNRNRLAANGGLWIINSLASPIIILPLALIASENALFSRPETVPVVVFLLIDVVLLDFWTYLTHRAYHKVPLMWRLHEVHHLDEHLDSTSAVRFHIGEVFLSSILRMAPILSLIHI